MYYLAADLPKTVHMALHAGDTGSVVGGVSSSSLSCTARAIHVVTPSVAAVPYNRIRESSEYDRKISGVITGNKMSSVNPLTMYSSAVAS